jgi:hypothetical protein
MVHMLVTKHQYGVKIISFNFYNEQLRIIKSIIATINFLINSEDEAIKLQTFSTPSSKLLSDSLNKYDFNIASFTVYLNKKFHITNSPLWLDSPREFFNDDYRPINFYLKALKMLSNDII